MESVIIFTCLAIIWAFFQFRNMWVFDRITELNRFENGVHIVTLYYGYHSMFWRFWVWDVEKMRLPADEPNIDRALAIADAALAPESISDTLHDCAHKDTGKVRAAVAYGKREAAE